MSHRGLQRALVVALHDPGFLAAAAVDPTALAGFDLDGGERAELLAIDRRALAVDRLRARRLLRVLVEELTASTAVALADTRSLAFADRFFAAPEFRAAVAGDRPLALAFGAYLAAAHQAGVVRSPHLPAILGIELARARARRLRARPGVALAVEILATSEGALAAIQIVEQHLFEVGLMPHVALVDDRPPLPPLPLLDGAPLHLVFQRQGRDVALEAIDPPVHRALAGLAAASAAGPLDRSAAVAALAALGLPVARPQLLLDELIASGWVTETSM